MPQPIALCDDPDVIGAAFYLMECVDGKFGLAGVDLGEGNIPTLEEVVER